MSRVTLFITACNRADLLKRTLESFLKYNTYPIEKCIITEDSDQTDNNDFAISMCPFPVEIIYNGKNMGHCYSIEKGYAKITTEYIFHCEEDWEFFKPGFIEKSLEILEKDPSVITVQLRSHVNESGHMVEEEDRGGYHYMTTFFLGVWHGFTLNPGLRRLSDYTKFAPWTESCKDIMWHGIVDETCLSIFYYYKGYRGATTTDKDGFVKHIGWDRHVPRPQDAPGFFY